MHRPGPVRILERRALVVGNRDEALLAKLPNHLADARQVEASVQGGEERDPAPAERRQVQPVDVCMNNVELAATPHAALRASWNRRSRTGSPHGRARPARRPAKPQPFPYRRKVSGERFRPTERSGRSASASAPQLSAALREAAHTSRRPATSAIRTLSTDNSAGPCARRRRAKTVLMGLAHQFRPTVTRRLRSCARLAASDRLARGPAPYNSRHRLAASMVADFRTGICLHELTDGLIWPLSGFDP